MQHRLHAVLGTFLGDVVVLALLTLLWFCDVELNASVSCVASGLRTTSGLPTFVAVSDVDANSCLNSSHIAQDVMTEGALTH